LRVLRSAGYVFSRGEKPADFFPKRRRINVSRTEIFR
jgi:hypothetical protein